MRIAGVAGAHIQPDDRGGRGLLRLDLVRGVDEIAVATEVGRQLRDRFGIGIDAGRVQLVEDADTRDRRGDAGIPRLARMHLLSAGRQVTATVELPWLERVIEVGDDEIEVSVAASVRADVCQAVIRAVAPYLPRTAARSFRIACPAAGRGPPDWGPDALRRRVGAAVAPVVFVAGTTTASGALRPEVEVRESEGVVSLPPLVEPAEGLTPDEVRRYSRHLIIPDVAMTGQKRLKNARVLAVGAGGLGSPVLMYLAAAGVGTLGVIDFDVVDESNLQRQIIHRQSDVGRLKAESARDAINEVNPHVRVRPHTERLDSSNALDIFAEYDLIVDGTDNFATRYLVNDACVLLGKPYVWGSIYRFDGQASVFWAEYGPCYRCLYPEPPPPGMVPSCAEGGVLGVLCASIGSIQATEAVKVLTGTGEPLVGRLLVYDALEMAFRDIKVRKDPECPICGKNPTITDLQDYEAFCGVISDEAMQAAQGSTLTASELAEMRQRGEQFLLVDVREPAEFEIVRIPDSMLIPKGELPSRMSELPLDRPVILYCKTGIRSAESLAVLKAAGFSTAKHVQGGVTAWSLQVDRSLPIY